jgi:uncharacterized protein YceK
MSFVVCCYSYLTFYILHLLDGCIYALLTHAHNQNKLPSYNGIRTVQNLEQGTCKRYYEIFMFPTQIVH